MPGFESGSWTVKARNPVRGTGEVVVGVRRWDGAARGSAEWDSLRKDPELWLRNGNCLVHLYSHGQSRRGPSFKVPFLELLAAECFPLVERFLVIEGESTPRTAEDLIRWHNANPHRQVELYIPPPIVADKKRAFQYHLATRNFFAWVFRRSLVGEHLGDALINLLHSMHEFRSPNVDNVDDIFDYMDEEGYLDLTGQPDHALGLLHFAEAFQMQDAFTRAFAHCVGMSTSLHLSPAYTGTSDQTKKLIRKARADLTSRQHQAAEMLSNFIEQELSDTHLSLPTPMRAHLDRFRSFLLAFYSAKFGYYPPSAFNFQMYQTMHEDFEALYDLLADKSYKSSEMAPAAAANAACALQHLRSFDYRHQYSPLEHPLPLLPRQNPTTCPGSRSRGMMRLWRGDKPTLSQQQAARASLANASNWKEKVFQNDLVRAYKQFEDGSITSPNSGDRHEKVSLADARKVRWILAYAVYQVLRSVTQRPEEARFDIDAPYSLSVSSAGLPPWKVKRDLAKLLRRQTDLSIENSALMVWDHVEAIPEETTEPKPDTDHSALARKALAENHQVNRRASVSDIFDSQARRPLTSASLNEPRGSRSTARRSMRIFKPARAVPSRAGSPAPRQAYHQIVIDGYGNGTNKVNFDDSDEAASSDRILDAGSDSTGSKSNLSAESPPQSLLTEDSSVESPTCAETPSPVLAASSQGFVAALEPKPLRLLGRESVSVVELADSGSIPEPQTVEQDLANTGAEMGDYSAAYEAMVEDELKIFGLNSPEFSAPPREPFHRRCPEIPVRRRSFVPNGPLLRTSSLHTGRTGREAKTGRRADEWAFMDGPGGVIRE